MSYILSPQLERAIQVAIHLNKPLLLCGEPGTGKTKLAEHLAKTYNESPIEGAAPFYPRPLIFNTKTTSTATDLFYSYDALSRLRDAYAQSKVETGRYIKLNAFGRAIALKHGAVALKGMKKINTIKDLRDDSEMEETKKDRDEKLTDHPSSSIVLIDEIDKAPRDFPNDLLNEIENHEFEIRELETKLGSPDNNANVFVIMTSNNEKNLPEAFLRRCVFHYIDFPNEQVLEAIIRVHFKIPEKNRKEDVPGVINTFRELRKQPLLKRPATAELLDWLSILEKEKLLEKACEPFSKMPADIRASLEQNMGVLLKNINDIKQTKEVLRNSVTGSLE